MIVGLLFACATEPVPPPVDLGPVVPGLEVHTRVTADQLVAWAKSPEDGLTRYSDAGSGRTALLRDGALVSAARELDEAACAAARAPLDELGTPETSCEDHRWPLDGGHVVFTSLAPEGGCVIAFDRDDRPLDRRPLQAMADFRGATFGATVAAIPDLVLDPDGTYRRPTDALDWGGVPLQGIRYRFDEGRLWQVDIAVAPEERDAFDAAWSAVFGPSGTGWWQGCEVSASWEYSASPVFGIRSRSITWERSRR